MITVDPIVRHTEHRNCTQVLKGGGKVMDKSVQGVNYSVTTVAISSEIYKALS